MANNLVKKNNNRKIQLLLMIKSFFRTLKFKLNKELLKNLFDYFYCIFDVLGHRIWSIRIEIFQPFFLKVCKFYVINKKCLIVVP